MSCGVEIGWPFVLVFVRTMSAMMSIDKTIRAITIAGLAAASLAILALGGSRAGGAEKQAETVIGRHIADFALPDVYGKPAALADFRSKPVVALVFVGTECPLANLYLPELMELQKEYESKGVATILINANASDSAAEIAQHYEKFKVTLPLLVDAGQHVADVLGAKRTPEVFVLDSKRVVRYHGRIDDRSGYRSRRG